MPMRIDISLENETNLKDDEAIYAYERSILERAEKFVASLDGVVSAHVTGNTLEGGLKTIVEPSA